MTKVSNNVVRVWTHIPYESNTWSSNCFASGSHSRLHMTSEGVNIVNVVVSGTQFWASPPSPLFRLFSSTYPVQDNGGAGAHPS